MVMEAEIGMKSLPAKEYQGLLATTRSDGARRVPPLELSERAWPADSVLTSSLENCKRIHLSWFKPPTVIFCLDSPRKLIQG